MGLTVAPFAGAWIEIKAVVGGKEARGSSLPSRERGLKSVQDKNAVAGDLSLPSRERGLKSLVIALVACISSVAPFAGAWIEI